VSGVLANQRGEPGCNKARGANHWQRLASAVKDLFPRGTAKHLSHLSGLQVRACFNFLARRSSLHSDALVALLDTEHGPEILDALMGDSKERWWIEWKLHRDKEITRLRLEAIERQISEIRGRNSEQTSGASLHGDRRVVRLSRNSPQ